VVQITDRYCLETIVDIEFLFVIPVFLLKSMVRIVKVLYCTDWTAAAVRDIYRMRNLSYFMFLF